MEQNSTEFPMALSANTILNGRYLIQTAEKASPYNIQYRAVDLTVNRNVTIVEYFEGSIMRRQPDGASVAYLGSANEQFHKNRESFLSAGMQMMEQGKTLGKPGELVVTDVFRENHTCYLVQMVMEGVPVQPERMVEPARETNIKPQERQTRITEKKHKKTWILPAALCGVLAAGVFTVLILSGRIKIFDGGSGSGSEGGETTTSSTSGGNTTSNPENEEKPAPSAGPRTHTVMLYMCGSNLESGGTGTGSMVLNEILEKRFDTKYDNLIIYTGGAQDWVDSRIPDGECAVWKSTGTGSLVKLETYAAPQNMGAADTLSSFVNYCDTHYPADSNALIFWDHGGGSVVGFGQDELYHGDSLTLEELMQALSDTSFGGAHKLDWIGFDTCLMASLETADAVDEYARYLLASEELEPGAGWDYSFLENLGKDPQPRALCRQIIDDYFDRINTFEEQDAIARIHSVLTLSCMDLAHVEKTKTAVDGFAKAALGDWNAGKKAEVLGPRARVKQIALLDSGGRDNAMDLVDLGDLAACYKGIYPNQMNALTDALGQLVCEERANAERLNGLSLYYPCDSWVIYSEAGKNMLPAIAPSASYADFVRTETDLRIDEISRAAWQLNAQTTQEGDVRVHLSADQKADCYLAYANIFMDTSMGYVPVEKQIVLYPDANGDLILPAGQKLMYFHATMVGSGEDKAYIIPVTQLEDTGRRAYYTTDKLTLEDEAGLLEAGTGVGKIDVSAGFSGLSSAEDEEMTLHGIYMQEAQDAPWWVPQTGRNTVLLDLFAQMTYTLQAYTPKMAEDGTIAPYTKWPKTGDYDVGVVNLLLIEGMDVVRTDIREAKETFSCQIIVEDIYGVRHGTNVVRMSG